MQCRDLFIKVFGQGQLHQDAVDLWVGEKPSAAEAGRSPQEHADITSTRFREVWDLLNISYDDFIRTTDEYHESQVVSFIERLKQRKLFQWALAFPHWVLVPFNGS